MESIAEDPGSFLGQLLAASRDAFVVFDPQGAIAMANDAARSLLCLCRDDALPAPGCDFLTEDGKHLPSAELPWRRAVAGEQVSNARVLLRCRTGQVALEVTAAPLRGDDGAIVGAAASLSVCEISAIEALREELARREMLEEVTLAATSAGDLHTSAMRALKVLGRRTGLLAGQVRVLSLDGITLVPTAAYQRDGESFARVEAILATGGQTLEQLAFSRRVVMTHEDEGRAEDVIGKPAEDEGIRYAAIPIEFRKRVIGTLSLAFEGRRSFREAEIELFSGVAHVLGQVAAQARRLEAQEETARRAEGELEVSALLLEAAERLARPLGIDEVLDALADSVARVTRRQRVFVVMLNQRTSDLVVRAVRGAPSSMVGVVLARNSDAFREMLESGPHQPTLDELPATERQRDAMRAAGVARGLVVPIVHHGRILGAVLADEPGSDAEFDVRELQVCENVANLAAAVIENARSYEAEHRIAETLQETLLLMPDHVDGVVFGTLYRSATAAARVGGDFFDIFEAGDGRVALVVGDVSGKGLDAASVTALARNAVRIHASEGLSPSAVMDKTNEVLRRFTSPETFVTAFFGVLELETGALTYVSAGHPEAMVVGSGGYVHRLAGDSPLLGAFHGATFAEQVTILAPADTVFMYTDGVIEARCDGELYGCERLGEFLGSIGDNDPVSMPALVFAEVEAFSKGQLRDDIAMLAVRREKAADP